MAINVKVKKLRGDVEIPFKATASSVGADLKVYLDIENGEQISKIVLQPNQEFKCHSGIAVEIPEGYFMQIAPRSSMGVKKNLILKNTVGIIDSDYRGEILLFVKNIGSEPITIEHKERIAQAIILPNLETVYEEATELSDTERGEGGFGSSGRK